MKKRILALFAAALLLFSHISAIAQAPHLAFTAVPTLIRPGKLERLSFTSAHEGSATLSIEGNGIPLTEIRQNVPVSSGENHLTWDGYLMNRQAVAEGQYRLILTLAEDQANTTINLGPESPADHPAAH